MLENYKMVVPIKIHAVNYKATGEFHLQLKTIDNFSMEAQIKTFDCDYNKVLCKQNYDELNLTLSQKFFRKDKDFFDQPSAFRMYSGIMMMIKEHQFHI